MKKTAVRFRIYLPVFLLLGAGFVTARPAPISTDCNTHDDNASSITQARELIQKKHSSEAMVCAAKIYYQLASTSQATVDTLVEAMTAMNEVLYFLRIITAQDLMGVDRANVERIAEVEKELLGLVQLALPYVEDNPAIMVNVALAAKITDGIFDTALLERAIEKDPAALKGLALIKLGRLLFNLPSILGGDFQQSIALLEKAVEVDPNNIQALYYLAEAYEQEMLEEKAAATMTRMLEQQADVSGQQMAADMLRLAIGLSKRMGNVTLSKKLEAKRKDLFRKNPDLLSRVSIAVGGHGGEHPLESDQ